MSFEQYSSFKGDSLLVLTGKDADYDKAITEAISQYWKASPYRFVNEKELYTLANSESYSMLVLDKSSKTRGTTTIRRKHLSLFPCGRSADLTNYGGKYAVSQFSLYDVENSSSFNEKLPFLLRSMQAYLTFLDTAQSLMEDTYEAALVSWKNAHRSELKNMTLIIPADNLEKGSSEDDLKAVYPYKLEVVKATEIGKFRKMEEGAKALFQMDARKRNISIIAEDGRVLYYGEAANPGELSARDLKAIGKAVDTPYEEGNSLESRFNRFGRKLNKKLNTQSGKN